MRRFTLRAFTLGVIIAAVLLPGAAARAARPPSAPATVEHLIVVGVTGLRWSDVTPQRSPTLARLAAGGAVGSLSVRAAPAPPQVTCPGEGWLTLGAGAYAAVVDPAGLDPTDGCAGRGVRAAGGGARR